MEQITERSKNARAWVVRTRFVQSDPWWSSSADAWRGRLIVVSFPTRSSVVKVTGTRDEAIALTQDRIRNWRKRQKLKARATT
jgi:hypothetical protein